LTILEGCCRVCTALSHESIEIACWFTLARLVVALANGADLRAERPNAT
jgi:hypothetical protein